MEKDHGEQNRITNVPQLSTIDVMSQSQISLGTRYKPEYNPIAQVGLIRSHDGRVTFSLDRELPPQNDSFHVIKITDIEERDTDYLIYGAVQDYTSDSKSDKLENRTRLALKFIRPGTYSFAGNLQEASQRRERTIQRYERNSKFSAEYIGICRLVGIPTINLSKGIYASTASIDSLTAIPSTFIDDSKAECALVIEDMHANTSLSAKLASVGISGVDTIALNRAIMEGTKLPVLPPTIDNLAWGSSQQLKRKLLQNLQFIDLVKRENNVAHLFDEVELETTLDNIQDTMLYAVGNPASLYIQQYFPQRQPSVTECHGDYNVGNLIQKQLKNGSFVWRRIDCIDSNNPDLFVLDPVNDYAMLPTDIVVRTGAVSQVNEMVRNYFEENKLNGNPEAVAVFDYAVLEKLWVLFYVRLLFDKDRSQSELQKYLQMMQKQIPKVQRNILEQPHDVLPTFV